jgi:hypothetical protein
MSRGVAWTRRSRYSIIMSGVNHADSTGESCFLLVGAGIEIFAIPQ